MYQNEVTKHISVGNNFCQATMHARIFCICCTMAWIRLMVKSRPNMKEKKRKTMRSLIELVYCL